MKLIEYMDDFLKLMKDDESLDCSDIDRYFGRTLSMKVSRKNSYKIPKSRHQFSPKLWCMNLQTELNQLLKRQLYNDSLKISGKIKSHFDKQFNISISKNHHLTWIFFGDCESKMLSKVYHMFKNLINQHFTFDDHELKFDRLNFFQSKSRTVIVLGPDEYTNQKCLCIRSHLMKLLGNSISEDFEPHITLMRIKGDLRKDQEPLLQALKEIEPIKISFKMNHLVLKRHVDHHKNQKVFGIFDHEKF